MYENKKTSLKISSNSENIYILCRNHCIVRQKGTGLVVYKYLGGMCGFYKFFKMPMC